MAAVEIGLRSAAAALLVLFALLLLRALRHSAAGPLGLLYAYGVASYLICPPIGRALGWSSPLTQLCFVGGIGAAVFFWLFARALFDDEFRPRLWHGLAAAAVIAVGLVRRAYPDLPDAMFGAGPGSLAAAFYGSSSQVISLGFVFLTLAQTALGRRADLVAARRRVREVFVALSGGYITVIVVVEIFLAGRGPVPWLDLLNVATILVVVLAAMLYLLRLRTDLFPQAAAPAGAPEPADQGLLDALIRAMEEECLYRREGLTIGALADSLDAPEHHLRRLINRRLGHRNFNQFLNGHRVAEARARLADPAEARLPVLTIAMDLGYRSLGPFNKAFKEITGQTPSEYRKAALAVGGAAEKPS